MEAQINQSMPFSTVLRWGLKSINHFHFSTYYSYGHGHKSINQCQFFLLYRGRGTKINQSMPLFHGLQVGNHTKPIYQFQCSMDYTATVRGTNQSINATSLRSTGGGHKSINQLINAASLRLKGTHTNKSIFSASLWCTNQLTNL